MVERLCELVQLKLGNQYYFVFVRIKVLRMMDDIYFCYMLFLLSVYSE